MGTGDAERTRWPRERITGFHQDEHGDWIAELACGHRQHVRHNPPWFIRPWVVSEAGRNSMLGRRLPCRLCSAPQADA